jgi:hypothetical protein
MLKRVETNVERAWCQRLKPYYDEPLSNFAFNISTCTTTPRQGRLPGLVRGRHGAAGGAKETTRMKTGDAYAYPT